MAAKHSKNPERHRIHSQIEYYIDPPDARDEAFQDLSDAVHEVCKTYDFSGTVSKGRTDDIVILDIVVEIDSYGDAELKTYEIADKILTRLPNRKTPSIETGSNYLAPA